MENALSDPYLRTPLEDFCGIMPAMGWLTPPEERGRDMFPKIARALLATALITISASNSVVNAGPIEDGIAAYQAREFETAAGFWRAAAEAGDSLGQYYMGFLYEQGQGVERDSNEAIRWYILAGDQGYAPALNQLGLMFADGDGVEEDDAEAVKLFRRAAEMGSPGAQWNLGVHLNSGSGTPTNRLEAYAWITIAATQGHALADRLKLTLEAELPLETIEQGLEMAGRFWDLYVVPFQTK